MVALSPVWVLESPGGALKIQYQMPTLDQLKKPLGVLLLQHWHFCFNLSDPPAGPAFHTCSRSWEPTLPCGALLFATTLYGPILWRPLRIYVFILEGFLPPLPITLKSS